MKQLMRLFLMAAWLPILLMSCRQSAAGNEWTLSELEFPYQSFLDNMGENDGSPTIGNDGQGFDAISHNIVYLEVAETSPLSQYTDSLLQIYNIVLAYKTMNYDVGTAERYIEEPDFVSKHADALDSINLSGIKNPKIKEMISTIAHKRATVLRKGKMASEEDFPEIEQFYDATKPLTDILYNAHLDNSEFYPIMVMPNYLDLHTKAITDTVSFRSELLDMVMKETDFQKKCVLARELAYANYHSPMRDDKQVVAVLDKLLRTNKYSPLLGELWRMWRCMLQINILGGRSNDSAMYNLFYNQMKNRVALVYIFHLNRHPEDKIALKEFVRLIISPNIVRDSGFLFGNNGYIEDMELFYSVFQSETTEDSEA